MSRAFDEAPETGCDVRRKRVGQGARRVPGYRPGERRRRFRTRGRRVESHAGCVVGALGRCARARTRPTPRCCWRSFATCPTSGAEARSSRRARWCTGLGRRWCGVRGRATLRENRGATADLATTRCSSRRDRRARRPSCLPEEKDAASHRGRALSIVGACVTRAGLASVPGSAGSPGGGPTPTGSSLRASSHTTPPASR